MTIDKVHTIDMIGTRDNTVSLLIIEGRKWEDIKGCIAKTFAKINNYKNHIESEDFKSKYKNKKIELVLESQYEPPKVIKKMLKDENVILSINRSYLKKSS
jgi:hypothetical protein